MKITYLHIKNFKSIRDLEIKEIDNALILVGKNNTGKTGVIDAIRAASGKAEIYPGYFIDKNRNISVTMRVEFDEKDLFAGVVAAGRQLFYIAAFRSGNSGKFTVGGLAQGFSGLRSGRGL